VGAWIAGRVVLVVRLVRVPVPEAGDRNHCNAPSSWFWPPRCSIVVVGPGPEAGRPGARGARAAAGARRPGRPPPRN